jgi:hypothetical protein
MPRPGISASFAAKPTGALAIAVVLLLALATAGSGPVSIAAAQQADLGFSPVSGHAQVIAQGVVPLPPGDVVWRTVLIRAPLPADSAPEARALGFVLASAGPLLLVDSETGEQTQLGVGEAALTRSGTVQQRASLTDQPVNYLSIELVPVDAPAPPDEATVLQPGQPFASPPGLHDLDLLSDRLQGDETVTVPDSGYKNVILITDGAANVGRPGGQPVVLLAGEAASFSGGLQVGVAPDSGDSAAFVVAMIGPELPAPASAATSAPQQPTAAPAMGTPAATSDLGSIAVQVYTCPPGMTAETVEAAACAPTTADFDITLSGDALSSPLTLADAAANGSVFTWSDLPFGAYQIAEAVMPTGSTTYVLSAKNASGGPDTGYRLTLDATQPDVAVRIYNFAPA